MYIPYITKRLLVSKDCDCVFERVRKLFLTQNCTHTPADASTIYDKQSLEHNLNEISLLASFYLRIVS